MFQLSKLFFIKAITPLHAGSGSDLGIVDMPVQRERHTNYPKIEGSSLKGAIREAFEEKAIDNDAKINVHILFGFDDDKSEVSKRFSKESQEYSGCLGFSDAKILLFPVKSMKDVFAYITSKSVLNNFKEFLKLSKDDIEFTINENSVTENTKLLVNNSVILEEYTFKVNAEEQTTKLANELSKLTNIPNLSEKLIILDDDSFKDFVELSTEVITRTKIDNETGTVANGALFTEEYLPAETVMYSLALFSHSFYKDDKNFKDVNKVKDYFEKQIPEVMQIGGNATLGKGIVKIIK